MKMVKVLAIVAAALLLAVLPAFSADAVWIRISLIEGDVQVETSGEAGWGPAALNGPLREGHKVWVPPGGRMELQLPSGLYLRLDGSSSLQILSLLQDSSQFYLSQGRLYVYAGTPRGYVTQIDTPGASTRAFDSSVFGIDLSDGYMDVAVYKGYLETENLVGRTMVEAGELLSLARDSSGELSPLGPPDEWEQWNKRRNDQIFARTDNRSRRYLPPELRVYAHDFDAGGRWVDVPGYGYSWVPRVRGGETWAPYRLGRWVWIDGYYVWISHDPWGWAPYHYGRWGYRTGIGWFWVPPMPGQAYWGPGYVGWAATTDYVAWVPLAPREIYFGRGYYGPYSIDITTVRVDRITIISDFRHVNVAGSVVVINRHSFAAGLPTRVHLRRNIIRERLFTRRNISIGEPEIRPSRAGRFMSVRKIPSDRLPPQRIRELEVRQLQRLRPLVRNPEQSVLRRGEIHRPLPLNRLTAPRRGRERPALRQPQILPGERLRERERREIRPVLPERAPGAVQPRIERQKVRPGARERSLPGAGEAPKIRPRPFQAPPSERLRERERREMRPVLPERTPGAVQPRIERQKVRPGVRERSLPGAGEAPVIRPGPPQTSPGDRRGRRDGREERKMRPVAPDKTPEMKDLPIERRR